MKKFLRFSAEMRVNSLHTEPGNRSYEQRWYGVDIAIFGIGFSQITVIEMYDGELILTFQAARGHMNHWAISRIVADSPIETFELNGRANGGDSVYGPDCVSAEIAQQMVIERFKSWVPPEVWDHPEFQLFMYPPEKS